MAFFSLDFSPIYYDFLIFPERKLFVFATNDMYLFFYA